MKLATLAVLAVASVTAHGASRESFDASWKFARFGAMPDGSRLAEPGAPNEIARASTSEPAHPAKDAVDGNPETRWCVANGSADQFLTVDLGRVGKLSGVEIDWEKPAIYPFKLESSSEGTKWQLVGDSSTGSNASGNDKITISASARFLRVTVGKTPPTQWASIREIRILDSHGNPVKPAQPDTGENSSPAASAFNDGSWRTLNLPHDWGIEGPFRQDLENETGKLPWAGIGWYRKTLDLPAADSGKAIYLDFDGAMSQATVFVNGKPAGEWAYGYNSFRIDLTPLVKFGESNTVALRLDNAPGSSRWYPGGGIYRHVWLVKADPIHFSYNSIFARSENVSSTSADLVIDAEVTGAANTDTLKIVHEVLDASGKRIASGTTSGTEGSTRITINSPTLWETDKPYLYRLRSTLVKGIEKVDTQETPIGIRTAEWKADGFYLNGKRVQIQGVCNHHDLGAIGAAFNERAAQRQLELLQEMGCNSIRTSHNPPAPQLLDLCDRMGFLVLDELFDTWTVGKKPNDYHLHFDAWHTRDVENFIRRDRNHPSVIAWSTGNEIPEQGTPSKHWISKELTDLMHKFDPTRMVTNGCNHLNAAYNGFAETIDIFGINYPVRQPKLAAELHTRKPNLPILITESSSCVSSRGCYYFPAKWDKGSGFFDFQVSSYELYAPGWANRPDLDFELLDRNPFITGEYVWTGFDYFGEPTPYNQDSTNALNFQNPEERAKALEDLKKIGNRPPSRSSYFGILDLCGFPKDRFYLYQAHWRKDFPMAHILPHWNWQERIGEITPVHVFTSGDEAELFLNGKSLGRKKKDPFTYRIVWEDVKYQPGELKVIAYKDGKKWAEAERSTTGPATQLLVSVDRSEISDDGSDLSYITVTVADSKGRLVPRSMDRLDFKIEGDAEIVAICNGDATSHESLQGTTMPAFNGLCQVILRGKPGAPGKATLSVASGKLTPGRLAITTR